MHFAHEKLFSYAYFFGIMTFHQTLVMFSKELSREALYVGSGDS